MLYEDFTPAFVKNKFRVANYSEFRAPTNRFNKALAERYLSFSASQYYAITCLIN